MLSFADLIEPVSLDQFFKESFCRNEAAFFGTPADRAAEILSWDNLNQTLSKNELLEGRLRLFQNEKALKRDQFMSGNRVDPVKLRSVLSADATLIMNQADTYLDRLGYLCRSLEKAVHVDVGANLYATFGSERGFDVHWDDHDVVILQIDGEKDWSIYGVTRPHPLATDMPWDQTPSSESIIKRTLKPGDIAYVPRGCWHRAQTDGKYSLHVTIGLYFKTGIDYLTWIRDQCLGDEFFRQDLPQFADADQWNQYARDLHDRIASRFTDFSLARFLAWSDETTPARASLALPSLAGDTSELSGDTQFTFCVERTPSIETNPDQNTLTLRANRHELIFASRAKPALDLLIKQRRCTFRELTSALPGDIDATMTSAFVKELESYGLIARV